MHRLPPLLPLLIRYLRKQPSRLLALRQQNPALLKRLSYSCKPISRPIYMSLWRIWFWNRSIMGLGQSATGENVGGGEGGGGLDAVEEQDLVLGGDEEDAVDYVSYIRELWILKNRTRRAQLSYLELGLGAGGVFGGFLSGL